MNHTASARSATHRTRGLVVIGLWVVLVVATVALGQALLASSSSRAVSLIGLLGVGPDGAVGEADGVVPGELTVFDDSSPAVTHLDPALLDAVRRAARRAAGEGIVLHVNSGWRSVAYQDQLLQRAVSEYGSKREAARWVATPTTSPHVSGRAIDLGPTDATLWLSAHGAAYGLCQIYGNEPWHFELRPRAVSRGCPRPYADPTQDPRMRGE